MSGEGFTLEDFIEQLGMLRKLGPLKNILGMMPGAAKNKELLSTRSTTRTWTGPRRSSAR